MVRCRRIAVSVGSGMRPKLARVLPRQAGDADADGELLTEWTVRDKLRFR